MGCDPRAPGLRPTQLDPLPGPPEPGRRAAGPAPSRRPDGARPARDWAAERAPGVRRRCRYRGGRSTRPAPAALPTYSGASGVRAQVRPSPAAHRSSARPPGNRRRRRHRPPLRAQRAEARLRHTPSTVRGRPRALRPWRPGIGRPVRHSRPTPLVIG